MKDMSIRLITENKKDFLPLLLLGDEQESQIDKYLEHGDLFALYDGNLKSVCVVTDEGGGILEIQNLATETHYQRQGYASWLIDYVAGYYAGRYEKIILGTGDVPAILAFYQHRRFAVTHRVADYFTTHYDHPIVEDGVLLKDKVYLERKLRQEETENIIIETDRLILRPLTCDDAETAFYGWTGDAQANKYVSWLPHHSIEDTIQWLKEVGWNQVIAGGILRNNYIWGFVLKETGELFGSGGLIWEEGCQLYQVGYNIKKSHWNNGYTTEAMKAILRYAAKNLGIKRVAGGHAKENLASAKVIEKLRFIYDRDDVTPHVDGIRRFDSRAYYLDLETEKPSGLAEDIDKLHTTLMGAERIKRNLGLQTDDVVVWCKEAVKNADITIGQGKNWYVYYGGVAITVNAHSFTIITAHKINAKVRVMRNSDYPCLPEFLYQAIYIPEGAEPPLRSVINDPEIFVYIKDFGTQPGDLGVAAEQNGQIVGAAWMRIIPAYGHIDNKTPELAISILPEFRSYGIGTKLMKKLFEVLRENGYKRTSLSVQKGNPAVRFYQRLGYEMLGERIDHGGHEDYLMIKYL